MEAPKTSRPGSLSGAHAKRVLALRFISGKYQGGEFVLRPNKEILIGRSSELDMVLVEDMVSRRHAKITTRDEDITIQDLDSTNGTFVNGERVTRAKLNEGDRILIGTSIIRLVPAGTATSGVVPYDQIRDDESKRRQGQTRTSMSGAIDEIPVPDLLQLFSTSKKSGVLVVRSGESVGRIYLKKGAVEFAVVNDNYDRPPVKAMFRILSWMQGVFEMQPPEEKEFANPLEVSIEGLLMEGMRQLDEMKRIEGDLPPPNALLAMTSPLPGPLRALEPHELDLIELIHNHKTLAAILDASPLSDYETCEVIAKLLKLNYVHTSW